MPLQHQSGEAKKKELKEKKIWAHYCPLHSSGDLKIPPRYPYKEQITVIKVNDLLIYQNQK